jgi:hypothetical protein
VYKRPREKLLSVHCLMVSFTFIVLSRREVYKLAFLPIGASVVWANTYPDPSLPTVVDKPSYPALIAEFMCYLFVDCSS